ncbi:hypothetical protein GGI17_003212 [Coemansia sp. S146]|nr:hypothetical protein GGI17_003212 [Coemansia sp. S146]
MTASSAQFAAQSLPTTLFCIARCLRTIIAYGRVLVLDKGKVAEFDTPWNLLQREGGIFRSMGEKSGEYEQLIVAAQRKNQLATTMGRVIRARLSCKRLAAADASSVAASADTNITATTNNLADAVIIVVNITAITDANTAATALASAASCLATATTALTTTDTTALASAAAALATTATVLTTSVSATPTTALTATITATTVIDSTVDLSGHQLLDTEHHDFNYRMLYDMDSADWSVVNTLFFALED